MEGMANPPDLATERSSVCPVREQLREKRSARPTARPSNSSS
jgi:hypothetical protein